ncbi:MAG TPA: glycoside hydrolase family 32 protein [Thermomicrobiales bacterium]|jgi:fructan beta-fructosidase
MDRPSFHFTPALGWVNDPNGLVYYQGEYHLFYQHDPHSVVGGGARMHWGHAVSADLVTWAECPVALAPDQLGAIWSGSAVVDPHDTSGFFGGGEGLVALYTQWRDGVQVQSIAYSTDRGRSWTKYADNPVIPAPELAVFRDPKVCWHEATKRWIMVVTIGHSVRFYGSPNLRDWQATGEFGIGYGSQAGIWECPDLFPLPLDGDAERQRWILLISVNGPGGSTMEYFVGDFDGATFNSDNPATTVLPFDAGRDCYAAVTWSGMPQGDGRCLAIGWLNNWRYARQMPGEEWRGAMTLPRELTLQTRSAGARLIQQPIAALAQLRGPAQRWPAQHVHPGTMFDPALSGKAVEIIVTFGDATAREYGLKVRTGTGYGAVVGYDTATQRLFIERAEPEGLKLTRFGGRQEVPLPLGDPNLTLHLFIDRCSIEVFADDGALVMSELFFPAMSTLIAPYCSDGSVELREMVAYALAPPT